MEVTDYSSSVGGVLNRWVEVVFRPYENPASLFLYFALTENFTYSLYFEEQDALSMAMSEFLPTIQIQLAKKVALIAVAACSIRVYDQNLVAFTQQTLRVI